MRRFSLVWSVPMVALAAACGASQDAPQTPPPAASAPVTPPVASAAPPVVAPHAPAPPLPPGIETASIDARVAPCDDFFKYACGGWIEAHPIPEDQASWGRFRTIDEENQTALRAILERDAKTPPGDEPYSKSVGAMYASCIDEAAVEKDGLKAIDPELKRLHAVHDAKSLAVAVGRLHTIGVHAFFETDVEPDFQDATRAIGAIDQAGLGMPDRDYYFKDDPKSVELQKKYVEHVARIFALIGEKPDAAARDAEAVFAFEKKLAAAHLTRVEHRDPQKTHHKTTREDLLKLAPTFAWDAYFTELGIPKVDLLNVYEPAYLQAIEKIVSSATKESWAQEVEPYLRAHVVMAYAKVLTAKIVDEDFAWTRELTGATKLLPRWKRCERAVDGAMGEALAIPFVKQKLGAEGKAVTSDMIKAIETAMEKDLAGLDWMDDPTRARALEKVHKVANKVGYPDKWRSYDALKVDRTSFAGNSLRATTFEVKRRLAEIGKPVDRTEWLMTPPTVNAYYEPPMNQMVFPAGILQAPFYSREQPQAVSFGGIGMVMGHELTHGFDDHGREFDGDGNLKEWWTPAVSTEFTKRASCVVDQFDGYVAVDDVHINGKLTLGENIADLGGLKLALAASHAHAQQKAGTSPEADRQFFIGFAQAWCESRRPEVSRMYANVDPHSPARYRVDGPLSNMPEFASAFSCREGDAMVRANRCVVW